MSYSGLGLSASVNVSVPKVERPVVKVVAPKIKLPSVKASVNVSLPKDRPATKSAVKATKAKIKAVSDMFKKQKKEVAAKVKAALPGSGAKESAELQKAIAAARAAEAKAKAAEEAAKLAMAQIPPSEQTLVEAEAAKPSAVSMVAIAAVALAMVGGGAYLVLKK